MSEQDFRDHVPLVHHLPKKSLWQRWTAWSGSFLVVSILLHIILLGGAAVLVVQVVQSRKEKLKFTAAPPSASAPAEHKVKPSKKTSAPAPSITKRITSTAVNAKVVLPVLDITSSTGTDVMASVMSSMGAAGLGAGSPGGAAGMASMPTRGLTAFGFTGGGEVGLRGNFYDLKQTPDLKPTAGATRNENELLVKFFGGGWNDDVYLNGHYFKATNSIQATQFFVPVMPSTEAPHAFDVEKFVQPSDWVIHYKGTVIASKDTRIRFRGRGDNILAVRFDGRNVFLNTLQDSNPWEKLFPGNQPAVSDRSILSYGSWINLEKNKSYPMEVLFSDYGGFSSMLLCVEEEHPETAYRLQLNDTNNLIYPLFQTAKGIPLATHKNSMDLKAPGSLPAVDINQQVFYTKNISN